MNNTYKHYSTECSLYSGKTRAYLRYKQIPHQDILCTKEVYDTIIQPRVGKKIIPVVITPDDQCLQDTTIIIDHLEEQFPDSCIYPSSPAQKLVALLFEVYGDEWLVMPAMHYRWHFKKDNLLFILKEFGSTMSPNSPVWLQRILGTLPAMAFGNLYKPYFGISKKMHRPIETSYEAFLKDFSAHLEQHDFLLGNKPSIGDFGLIAPLYAHLYRDPYPGKLMQRIAPNVARWVERMQNPENPNGGEFLANDQIPDTLMPLLKRMFSEQFPVLLDTIKQTNAWVAENPGLKTIKRMIGKQTHTIEGVTETRRTTPFSQWMFQRPLKHYAQLSAEQKAPIDLWLKAHNGYEGLNPKEYTELEYTKNRLRMAK